jgi:phosphonate transport system substrate-binding protein
MGVRKMLFNKCAYRSIFLLLVLLIFAICLGQSPLLAEEKGYEKPKDLTFAVSVGEIVATTAAGHEALLKHIAKVVGLPVNFYAVTSYPAIVESMVNVFAVRESGGDVEAFASYAGKPGHFIKGGPGYRGTLITKKGSGLDSIDKLKGRSLAFTEAASTSGFLAPTVLFPDKIGGKSVQDYFGRTVFTGAHDSSILAVKEGQVDAAFSNDMSMERALAAGLIKKDDLNILWYSPVVPRDSFSWRKSLAPSIRAKIKEAFLTFPKKGTGCKGCDIFWNMMKGTTFIEVDDSTYDVTRKLVAAKEKRKK